MNYEGLITNYEGRRINDELRRINDAEELCRIIGKIQITSKRVLKMQKP